MKNKTYEKIVTKGLSKAKYKHTDACKRDLLSVLASYKGLQPKLDTFVFDSGDERTLLNLNGTIPIIYRSNTYNIPVCFWLHPDHPTAAPMGFVQPTNDMQIKASQSVDYSGRMSLPYIEEWKYPEAASLLDLIKICVIVFGQSPPVFTKSKNCQNASTSAAAAVVALPPQQGSATASATVVVSSNSGSERRDSTQR